MLDLKRLSLLREVHRRGTLHAVARALSYSPSTISQQLSLLEREAGVALLERAGRRVHLTAAGQLLVERSSALLDEFEQLEADLVAASGTVTGTVRLAVFQSAALGIVPRALSLLAFFGLVGLLCVYYLLIADLHGARPWVIRCNSTLASTCLCATCAAVYDVLGLGAWAGWELARLVPGRGAAVATNRFVACGGLWAGPGLCCGGWLAAAMVGTPKPE